MNKWINLTWKIHSSVLILILSQMCTSQWKIVQHNPEFTRCKWTNSEGTLSLGGCRPMIICDHPSISIIIFTLYVQANGFQLLNCFLSCILMSEILFDEIITFLKNPPLHSPWSLSWCDHCPPPWHSLCCCCLVQGQLEYWVCSIFWKKESQKEKKISNIQPF